jgi:hypothetical protein
MKESQVEKYLNEQVKSIGGITRKWSSPNRVGVPDRICFFPGGVVVFVEVKTDRGRLSVRQERELKELCSFGASCYVVKGARGVNDFITKMKEIWFVKSE